MQLREPDVCMRISSVSVLSGSQIMNVVMREETASERYSSMFDAEYAFVACLCSAYR